MPVNAGQGIWWILTIPQENFTPYLPPNCRYCKGQLEKGEGGFLHWQVVVAFAKKARLGGVKDTFGPRCHAELTRSKAALEYVFKDDTAVSGTRFALGTNPIKQNSSVDWEAVRDLAKRGRFDDIPASIYVRCYNQLSKIRQDNLVPVGITKRVYVYWGNTGLGKSRRAWYEAGMEAYPKNPRSIYWDGYRSHERCVIDEFRGCIDIAHILRWTDRYPTIVEVKGSSVVLQCKSIWFTSNIHPTLWYPQLDPETVDALIRRLEIIEFTEEWVPPVEDGGITEIPDQ